MKKKEKNVKQSLLGLLVVFLLVTPASAQEKGEKEKDLKNAKDKGAKVQMTNLDPSMYDGSVNPDDPSLPNFNKVLINTDLTSSFYDTDMKATISMVNVSEAKGTVTRTNTIYRRDKDDLYVLITEEPASKKGQGTLRSGKNMWRYDPTSRKFAHTTLKDNYEDTVARNSDFRRMQRSLDYQVDSVLLGTLGQQKVFIADLSAVNDEVAFPFLRMWVTRDTQLVLKVEEYSLSKRLLRTSYYTNYVKIGQSIFPTTQIFQDGVVTGKRTQMQMKDISTAPLPDETFTKSFLERQSR